MRPSAMKAARLRRAVDDEVAVLLVLADELRDARALGDAVLAAGPDVVEHAACERVAQAVALERVVDLRVDHGDRVALTPIGREAGELPVHHDLVAGAVPVVDDVDVGHAPSVPGEIKVVTTC